MSVAMKTIGILPCAGTASRLFHLPKFMRALKYGPMSLLSNWVHCGEQKIRTVAPRKKWYEKCR